MVIIETLDGVILAGYSRVATFLQDWFYLSQRNIEKSLLILYVVAAVVNYTSGRISTGRPVYTLAIALTICFYTMWEEYREPIATRTARRFRPSSVILRVLTMGIVLFASIMAILVSPVIPSPTFYTKVAIYSMPVWILFNASMTYVTLLNIEGERGKSAKLSWEKLKELFGGWVPIPSHQGV